MSKKDNEIIKYLEQFMTWIPSKGYTQIKTCFNINKVPTDWRINRRCHDDFHLLFIRGGKGEYYIEGEHYPFKAGRILFLSYNTTHWGDQDILDPPSIIPLRFQMYSNETHDMVKPLESPFYYAFDPDNFNKYHHLFDVIYKASSKENTALRNSLSNAAILNLMATLYTDYQYKKNHQAIPEGIKRAKELMDQNPHIHMTSNVLAKEAELSTKYFGRIFKQSYGVTPHQYQIRNRIGYARFLIENTESSIKEIAFKLGYPDPYAFTKQFKQHIGVAPSKLH